MSEEERERLWLLIRQYAVCLANLDYYEEKEPDGLLQAQNDFEKAKLALRSALGFEDVD